LSTKDIVYLILIGVLLVATVSAILNQSKRHKSTIIDLNNLNRALNEDVIYLKNELGEEKAEKYAIQTDFKEIKSAYSKLNESQQELIRRINSLDKDNKVIAASLVKLNVDLSKLQTDNVTEITDSTITFSEQND